MTRWQKKMDAAMRESELKAWDALSKYKFWMFGYHAGAWVRDNRMSELKRANPFKVLVHVARAILKGHTITITEPPIAPSRRVA